MEFLGRNSKPKGMLQGNGSEKMPNLSSALSLLFCLGSLSSKPTEARTRKPPVVHAGQLPGKQSREEKGSEWIWRGKWGYQCTCVSHVLCVKKWKCSGSVVSNSFQPHGLCSLLSSSVRGVFQARALEWVAIFFSKGSSQPRVQTGVSHTADRFTVWAAREAQSSYFV